MTSTPTSSPATTALPLAPGQWTLDNLHSSVSFAIRHLGLAKVRGRFSHFDAFLQVGSSPEDVQVEATIAVSSIDTGIADRDAHVRSAEFLDVETHPTMRFRSTRIAGTAGDWTMEGEVTIAGTTRPVTFEVEFGGTSDAMGPTHAGFSTSGQVSRKDFGLDFGPVANAGLGDVIKFDLDLEFLAPE